MRLLAEYHEVGGNFGELLLWYWELDGLSGESIDRFALAASIRRSR